MAAAELGERSFDDDPILAGTWVAAHASASCAIHAATVVAAGSHRAAYALTRPPGHHAAPRHVGGYCYLANPSLAVAQLLALGARRVAVLDVDVHAGNGTQLCWWGRPEVLTVSIHGDPATHYPYYWGFADDASGLNLPLPGGTDWARYRPALDDALVAISAFGADALVVALGTDTAAEDHDDFELAADDYRRMGDEIAALGLPTVVTQEGGYHLGVLGRNVANVLESLA
jgi:acetoin utilization deacetylase AcuC-like enzyme